jgi:hypothetical protein
MHIINWNKRHNIILSLLLQNTKKGFMRLIRYD